jgi:hypothetical protein
VGLATAPRSETPSLDASLPTHGGPHRLCIVLGQARLLVSADIQPHVFVVHGKALRREKRPRLRIERPDIERHHGEPTLFGELDHCLEKGVATALPLLGPIDGDVVNMQALPGMAQRRCWPSDNLGIEVTDRFAVEGANEDTRVGISKQLADKRWRGTPQAKWP